MFQAVPVVLREWKHLLACAGVKLFLQEQKAARIVKTLMSLIYFLRIIMNLSHGN